MRCPDCNKFVGLEDGEPEINDESIDGREVHVEVRIVRTCADCGTELKEANFDITECIESEDIQGHWNTKDDVELDDHELAISCEAEMTSRSDGAKNPRYSKTFYGASVQTTVTCSCGQLAHSLILSDEIQAGQMDELC